MKNKMDILCSVLEYVLAFLFIRGGILIFFLAEPPLQVPAVLTLLVGPVAIYAYGLFFALTGAALLYSKWFKKVKLHKWVLFTLFIICAYVLALSIALNGITAGLWLTVACGITAAFLHLRWKVKTEYMTAEEVQDFFKK